MVGHTLMKQAIIIILTLCTLVCFGTPTKVTRIIDGDTFETETGEKVRLVGINAPEISDIFGEEAKAHLSQLIGGQTVDLLPDHISSDRDRYNRLLRYVIVNGVDINRQMIADGFAFAYLKYHFDKAEEYKETQIAATKNHNGMWGSNINEKIAKQQDSKENFWNSFSLQQYLIGGLILLLIFIGAFYYFIF